MKAVADLVRTHVGNATALIVMAVIVTALVIDHA